MRQITPKYQQIEDTEIIINSGKEHRFVVMFRGEGLTDGINDTDPQQLGVPPKPLKPQTEQDQKSATVVQKFIEQANALLQDEHPANTFLLRGIAQMP